MSNDPVIGLGSFTDKLALGEAQRGTINLVVAHTAQDL